MPPRSEREGKRTSELVVLRDGLPERRMDEVRGSGGGGARAF